MAAIEGVDCLWVGHFDLSVSLGIPGEKDYVRRYCERTGRGDPDAVMADWNFYMAYNLFRMAAILHGIAQRAAQGNAAAADAVEVGARAGPLADRAFQPQGAEVFEVANKIWTSAVAIRNSSTSTGRTYCPSAATTVSFRPGIRTSK